MRQDNSIQSAVGVTLLSISLSACLMQSGGGTSSEQSRVMVNEVMSICGAIVGDQAEQRYIRNGQRVQKLKQVGQLLKPLQSHY